MSAYMYLVQPESVAVQDMYDIMGFPAWMIVPLGIAKLLGVIAIVTRLSSTLKEYAYAGFLFDFLMAIGAHMGVDTQDAELIAAYGQETVESMKSPALAIGATVLWAASKALEKKAFG
jgi:hypothetical protein